MLDPVKQFEPFFNSTYEYEDEAGLVEWGGARRSCDTIRAAGSYRFGLGGQLLYQNSNDGGECWMLADATEQRLRAWNGRGSATDGPMTCYAR
ncbi:hypothetical protein BE08_41480 [Sorangium cellulosum]|uniref:Uncharacterized protein n=1 Tax=Sorangium cellulosum TaxID=56 RepID=A0A150PL50_SORCE|nr:hypothetical protein BE08_41480 [Sorangium cellulosum]